MEQYDQKIELYSDLKDAPESTREAYRRRMKAFLNYTHKLNRPIESITEEDIQYYILYLKKVRQEQLIIIFHRLNSIPRGWGVEYRDFILLRQAKILQVRIMYKNR